MTAGGLCVAEGVGITLAGSETMQGAGGRCQIGARKRSSNRSRMHSGAFLYERRKISARGNVDFETEGCGFDPRPPRHFSFEVHTRR